MEDVNSSNIVSHVKTLYGFVKKLADNHDEIVTHIKNIHKNVNSINDSVKQLRETVNKPKQITLVKR